jgi:hypothetical protein
MISYTNEEILAACQVIWDREHKRNYMMGWEKEGCVKVLKNTDKEVQIEFACMYGAPNLNLTVLEELSEFLGTTNINDDNHFSEGGCETCDYGSSYGYTLTARPKEANV